jgi:hypothetical protein
LYSGDLSDNELLRLSKGKEEATGRRGKKKEKARGRRGKEATENEMKSSPPQKKQKL